ncbi:MAG: hypothetical protein JKY80_09455 [Mariprofundaceae bacterium]|nr:hypothetical protein [Mariprofundaceae bacterium]
MRKQRKPPKKSVENDAEQSKIPKGNEKYEISISDLLNECEFLDEVNSLEVEVVEQPRYRLCMYRVLEAFVIGLVLILIGYYLEPVLDLIT